MFICFLFIFLYFNLILITMKKRLTPKEEANRLYRLFRGFNTDGNEETNHNTAIQIASLHIDEINEVLGNGLDFRNKKSILYYIDVKHELFDIANKSNKCDHPYFYVFQSDTECFCSLCGEDLTGSK